MNQTRSSLAEKYLQGRGIEFGALHNRLFTGKQAKVIYVDRYTKKELLHKFPELRSYSESIVSTDIIMDIDSGDFSQITEQNFDFFIANHVIEHLVNPIRFLKNIHEIMIPGSILYLAIPDKNYTFDKNRELTINEHLWHEYIEDINELSIEHLNDFILNITQDNIEPERKAKMYFKDDKLPFNWFEKRRIYKLHRERSIHVHVWNQFTFDQFLRFTIDRLKLMLEIVDLCSSTESSPEMIYILRKKL